MRTFVLLIGMFISLAACAQETPTPTKADSPKPAPGPSVQYRAGEHYDVIPTPVNTITGDKIEVTEVFWYGCGHCDAFEPMLNEWKKGLPDDVELIKSPAIWRKNMEAHARIFYAAQSLGILDAVHPKVFDAMHRERKALATEDEIASFFAQFDVSRADFDKVFQSFSVSSQVQQAGARARSFQITGTPEMVVDGRFRVSSSRSGGQEGMLKVADFLIQQIRDKKL